MTAPDATALDRLARYHLVPVVVLDDAAHADGLAAALAAGGLPVAEITFRTAAAEESIRVMAARGAKAIAALAAPFGGVRFVPTGGVGPGNVAEYLALPSVHAVGGSWMVPRDAIAAGNWTAVRELTTEAVALAATARPDRWTEWPPSGTTLRPRWAPEARRTVGQRRRPCLS